MADRDTLQTLLRRLAGFGAAPAVIAFSDDTRTETSAGALAEAALATGYALAAKGIGPGKVVAVVGPNGLPWITAFWAIVATGATVMAVDAQIPAQDLAQMLEVADCHLIFTTAARAATLPPGVEAILLDQPLPQASSQPLAEAKREDVALLLFTSGTTGTPKAVPLTHANLLSNVEAIVVTKLASASDRALLPLPLHHAYPLTVGMLTCMALGVTIILPSGVSGPELIAALKGGGATVLLGVPRLYSALVLGIRQRVASQPRIARRLFGWMLAFAIRMRRAVGLSPGKLLFGAIHRGLAPSLRLLVSGGAKLDTEIEETLGALGWEVMTGYGLTETSPILSFNRPGTVRAGSAGKPLPGVEIRFENVDADGNGEIEAKGASVFTGYHGDPEHTSKAFTKDGWFRTGDFGHFDGNGFLFIAARVSETIVLADGKKLFPEAVEAVYAEAPLVKEIALFALDGALVALVVPDLDLAREQGAARLKDVLRDGLAERAQHLPSHARLSGFAVARDKLPRTQLGKIRRHLVPAMYAEALSGQDTVHVAELSPEDKALLEEETAARLWEWLKARWPTRSLSLDMSPQLDLGIDSLAWVDLTLGMERDVGMSLTEREIGRIVTLRDLLREAMAAAKRPAPAAETAKKAAALPALGPGLRFIQWSGGWIITITMRLLFRLKVEGAANLPAKGAYLICPNHESYLDPMAVVAALPRGYLRRTWWGGWTGILHTTAFRRAFSKAAQIVPVDQYRGGAASLGLAAQVFAKDEALVWFPEGGLTRDGTLQAFQRGVGVLLMRHKVPVVPAWIDGSFESWPYGGGFPMGFSRFHPIRVRFGKPIPAETLLEKGGDTPQGIADALRENVAALSSGP